MPRTYRRICLAIGVVGILVILGAAVRPLFNEAYSILSPRWTMENIAESRLRGQRIVTALKSYRARNGRYPSELGQLVPDYLEGIPMATAGLREWGYSTRDEGTNYTLSFYANKDEYPCGWTDSNRADSEGWRLDE